MSKKTPAPLVPASPEEIEKSCDFFGGHCFSASLGVQRCLWCTATRQAPADAPIIKFWAELFGGGQ